MYETVAVDAGSVLSFGKMRSGCRAYLAVRGEWQVTQWLESASALSVGNVHLVAGSVITKDTLLEVRIPQHDAPVVQHPDPVASWPDRLTVSVLPGPEFKSFSAQQIAFFFNTVFTVSGESNRIGYRLEPLLPEYRVGEECISSGIIPGVVQITRQGQPIIMMSDAQTTGGYPRIANVMSENLDALAQLRPGNTLNFLIIKG
jgi:antagonist of KipI